MNTNLVNIQHGSSYVYEYLIFSKTYSFKTFKFFYHNLFHIYIHAYIVYF